MSLDKKNPNYKTPVDRGGTEELAIMGKDDDVVSKVEDTINGIGTTLLQKPKAVTKEQLKAILEGLKSKKLKLREDHNTEVLLDWEKLTLEFIAPNGSGEDLDAALNSLMSFIQGVVIHKETTVTNNAGLVVLLQKKNHWQQIVAIANQHEVTVKLVNNGIEKSLLMFSCRPF